jgi:hypothetical protein
MERWATEELVLFGVQGLERANTNTGWGAGVRAPGGDPRFGLVSSGLSFRDSEGRLIAVLCHRKDDDRLPRLREDAAGQVYRSLLRSKGEVIREPRWPDGWGAPEVPQVDWEPAAIPIDGQLTAFEVCRFDSGYWAAIGRAVEADVTLASYGVPLGGLELERTDERPPRVPPFRPPPALSERLPD